MEDTIFAILRLLVALTGTALIGRMSRDRLRLRKSHFGNKVARIRWLMMVALTGSVTLGAFIALLISAPVTAASYVMFINLAAVIFGHRYLDILRPMDEAIAATQLEAANEWLRLKLDK